MNKEQMLTLGRIGISLAIVISSFMMEEGSLLRLILLMVAYVIVGVDVLIKAVLHIAHGKWLDEKFLMTVATLGAIGIGQYQEAVAVMLFYQVGEFFGDTAVDRSKQSIAKLMDIRPDVAHLLVDGAEQDVHPGTVEIGQQLVVKPGERIPLDGKIVRGNTTVNLAALTGESAPVTILEGGDITSGGINLTGTVIVETTKGFKESTVSKIIELVEHASERKARTEGYITRFARVYTPIVVALAALLFIIPTLAGGDWNQWLYRGLVFLVVSCPCALVISVPLTFFASIGSASRMGILVKGANYLEVLSKTDTMIFDKTGTLTQGNFTVSAVHPEEMSQKQLLEIAAYVESYTHHPIGQSIIKASHTTINKDRIENVEEVPGKGIHAMIDHKEIYVGNDALMSSIGIKVEPCKSVVGTTIHLAYPKEYLGHIVISDEVKKEAKATMAKLTAQGILRKIMLTGDTDAVGQDVGGSLGMDEIHTQLLPQDKVALEEQLIEHSQENHRIAFVGDGINDAPVLMRADVGIAMGALGSDAAIEAADVVLMDDQLEKLPKLMVLSKKTMRIVRENIVLSLGIKFAILILGALGVANMWWAVVGDVGVLMLAVLNSLRMFQKIKVK